MAVVAPGTFLKYNNNVRHPSRDAEAAPFNYCYYTILLLFIVYTISIERARVFHFARFATTAIKNAAVAPSWNTRNRLRRPRDAISPIRVFGQVQYGHDYYDDDRRRCCIIYTVWFSRV